MRRDRALIPGATARGAHQCRLWAPHARGDACTDSRFGGCLWGVTPSRTRHVIDYFSFFLSDGCCFSFSSVGRSSSRSRVGARLCLARRMCCPHRSAELIASRRGLGSMSQQQWLRTSPTHTVVKAVAANSVACGSLFQTTTCSWLFPFLRNTTSGSP